MILINKYKKENKKLKAELNQIGKTVTPIPNPNNAYNDAEKWQELYRKKLVIESQHRTNQVISQIVKGRQSLFSWMNWPFRLQTEEELELYLYKYGVVLVMDLGTTKIFWPIRIEYKNDSGAQDTVYLNKLNIENVKFVAVPNLTVNEKINSILTKVNNQEEGWHKKRLPLIFDNGYQSAPFLDNQNHLHNLTSVYSANVSNRINKIITKIIAAENTAYLYKMMDEFYNMENYSPMMIMNKDKLNYLGKGAKELFGDGLDVIETAAADFYESLHREASDIIAELFRYDGVIGTEQNAKVGAQETDSQTFSTDREAANNMFHMLEIRKKWCKNLRGIFPNLKLDVTLKPRVAKFAKQAMSLLDNGQEGAKEGPQEAKGDNKQNDTNVPTESDK